MRILVCGGRDFTNYDLVASTLASIGPSQIIHGDARGADRLADRWAIQSGVPVRAFPADWKKHGRAAGPDQASESERGQSDEGDNMSDTKHLDYIRDVALGDVDFLLRAGFRWVHIN